MRPTTKTTGANFLQHIECLTLLIRKLVFSSVHCGGNEARMRTIAEEDAWRSCVGMQNVNRRSENKPGAPLKCLRPWYTWSRDRLEQHACSRKLDVN